MRVRRGGRGGLVGCSVGWVRGRVFFKGVSGTRQGMDTISTVLEYGTGLR
jgi:hypothetical protein